MKKIMSAAVAAAVMFSMAACSATEKAEEPETSDVQTEESATEKPETSKETTEVTEETEETEAPVESEEDIPVYLDYDGFVTEHHHEIADDEWDYVRYCVDNGFVEYNNPENPADKVIDPMAYIDFDPAALEDPNLTEIANTYLNSGFELYDLRNAPMEFVNVEFINGFTGGDYNSELNPEYITVMKMNETLFNEVIVPTYEYQLEEEQTLNPDVQNELINEDDGTVITLGYTATFQDGDMSCTYTYNRETMILVVDMAYSLSTPAVG